MPDAEELDELDEPEDPEELADPEDPAVPDELEDPDDPDDPVPVDPVPVAPVVPVAVVLDATVLMPPACVPVCQPARRIPAEAKAAATVPRIFTSQTFRDGSVPRGRRLSRHPQ